MRSVALSPQSRDGALEALAATSGSAGSTPDDELDILVVVGGVVPPDDYQALYDAGAAAIFGPGTVIADAAGALLDKLETHG